MFNNKWVWGVAAIAVVVGGLWYSGNLPGLSGDESAAAARAVSTANAANAIQKIVGEIPGAISSKDSTAFTKLQGDYSAAVESISVLIPSYDRAINEFINKGRNIGAAQAPLTDIKGRLSLLQSGAFNAQNAQAALKNFNAIYSDISAINTALQKK